MVALIFCAGGNPRFAAIALRHGFLYGVCSGATAYHPPAFLDLDHRQPRFERHLEWTARHRPRFAVAGDVETPAQFDGVLRQAEALRSHAGDVIVVPKATGLVERVPDWCMVGLSVPTTFGGTQAPFWEYLGRRVHLLGGSPQAQLRLYAYLGPSVVSVDGNSHMKAATRYGDWWERGRWAGPGRRRELRGWDVPYRAFERSCANIAAAWAALTTLQEEI